MPENPRLEELRRRVESDPTSIAFAALAEEYRRLGRHDEAVETCLAGLQRHPAYLSARVTLGRALIETGDLDSAREQFQTVLRSAPENLAAIRGLSQIHERLGESTEMDPHLAEIMREHVEAAEKALDPAAPVPVEFEPDQVALERSDPEPHDSLDFLEPLKFLESLEPDPKEPLEPERVEVVQNFEREPVRVAPAPLEPEPLKPLEPVERLEPLEPPEPLEPLQPSPFPSLVLAPEPLELSDAPDPAVITAISRLERFLAAIQHARHA